jgi:hypothetical protein
MVSMKTHWTLQAFIEGHRDELGTARRDAEVMVQVRLLPSTFPTLYKVTYSSL